MKVKGEYFGCKFYELGKIEGPVKATVSYGDKRVLFEGNLTIDRTEGSYAYGPELQIHLWARETPEEQKRAVNNGYARIEICMPITEGLDFLYNSVMRFYEAPGKVETKRMERLSDVL